MLRQKSDELLLSEYEPPKSEAATAENNHGACNDACNSAAGEAIIGILGFIGSGDVCTGSVVGISFTALALTFNEVMLMRRLIVRIGLATFALAFNEVVFVRRLIVGIGCATSALAVNIGVSCKLALFITTSGALRLSGAGCFAVLMLCKLTVFCITYRTLCLCFTSSRSAAVCGYFFLISARALLPMVCSIGFPSCSVVVSMERRCYTAGQGLITGITLVIAVCINVVALISFLSARTFLPVLICVGFPIAVAMGRIAFYR